MYNFLRFLASRRDFLIYVFHADASFRNGLGWALAGLVCSIVSVVLSAYDMLALLLALAFTVPSVVGAVLAWRAIGRYYTRRPDRKRFVRFESKLNVPGLGSVAFADLQPSADQRHAGFVSVSPNGSPESALTARPINDWLLGQPQITIETGPDLRYKCADFAEDADKAVKQLECLGAFVESLNCTNEVKYRLSEPLNRGDSSVRLSRISYFDMLVTNQAYRSMVMDRARHTDQGGDCISDLRGYFPVHVETDAERESPCLGPLRKSATLANSVGVSTLVISSDHYPIFFEQNKKSAEAAGRLTVLGSGSGDYQDWKREGANDFLRVVKRGVVREAFEEGSIGRLSDAKAIFADAIENTRVTGYFRWVSRAGKPEFTAITRINVPARQIIADGREVARLEKHKPFVINKMSDFIHLYETLYKHRHNNRRLETSLSSAMVLWRLAEIAADDREETRMFRKQIMTLVGLSE